MSAGCANANNAANASGIDHLGIRHLVADTSHFSGEGEKVHATVDRFSHSSGCRSPHDPVLGREDVALGKRPYA
jgi:hypothetical protein